MICNEAREKLSALADGELSAAERASIEAHLEGCEACAAEAERIRRFVGFLTDRLRVLRDRVKVDLTLLDDRVHAAPKKAAPRPKAPSGRRSFRIPAAVPAVGLLAVLGVIAWLALGRGGDDARLDVGGTAPVKPSAGEVRPDTPVRPVPDRPEPPPAQPTKPPDVPRVVPVRPGATLLLPRLVRSPTSALLEEIWRALAERPAEVANVLEALDRVEDPQVRGALVLALAGAPEDARVRERLLAILTGDSDPRLRGAAAAALARVADGEGRVGVIGGLSVPVGPILDADLRGRLVAAAETERDPDALGVLIRLLGPSQETDPTITERFIELARGGNEAIRDAAIDAIRLGRAEDSRVIYDLVFDGELPAEARARLVEPAAFGQPEKALENLRDILARTDRVEIKAAAVRALGREGSDEAHALAVEILRGGEPVAVRSAALGVVMTRRTKETLAILEELSRGEGDPGLRAMAEEGEKRLSEELEHRSPR